MKVSYNVCKHYKSLYWDPVFWDNVDIIIQLVLGSNSILGVE